MYCNAAKGGLSHSHRQHAQKNRLKFGHRVIDWCKQTDRHTHENTLHPSQAWSINHSAITVCSHDNILKRFFFKTKPFINLHYAKISDFSLMYKVAVWLRGGGMWFYWLLLWQA